MNRTPENSAKAQTQYTLSDVALRNALDDARAQLERARLEHETSKSDESFEAYLRAYVTWSKADLAIIVGAP